MLIFFGLRTSKIGTYLMQNSECSYCEKSDSLNITEYGRYFHVFWIPIFPLGRKIFSECEHCKQTIRKRDFDPKSKNDYNQNKSKSKRPIWHWTGLILLAILTIFVSVLLIK